jgi:hypothetical protein
MKMIGALFAASLAVGSVSEAGAQMRPMGPRSLAEGEIVIQSNRSITLRPESGADVAKQQDDAVRLIYRMAERECALVLETIGATCELTSVSTNVSSNEDGSVRAPMVRATGSFGMKVKLKS